MLIVQISSKSRIMIKKILKNINKNRLFWCKNNQKKIINKNGFYSTKNC